MKCKERMISPRQVIRLNVKDRKHIVCACGHRVVPYGWRGRTASVLVNDAVNEAFTIRSLEKLQDPMDRSICSGIKTR